MRSVYNKGLDMSREIDESSEELLFALLRDFWAFSEIFFFLFFFLIDTQLRVWYFQLALKGVASLLVPS
jgi:hypothetical protein